MYENINRHIIDKNINLALEECYKNEYVFLGLFLGRITNTNNKEYHNNMTNLYSLFNGGKKKVDKEDGPKTQIQPVQPLPNKGSALCELILNSHLLENHLNLEKQGQNTSTEKYLQSIQNQINFHFDVIEKIIKNTPSRKPIITEEEMEELEGKIMEKEQIILDSHLPTIPEVNVVKVKLYCNWMETKDITTLWSKMSQGNGKWNNIKLVVNEDADYHVIINCPPINITLLPKNTIYFQMEPKMAERPKLWGDWSNPPDKLFVKSCKYSKEFNNVEWHLSKTYQELKTMTVVKKNEYEGIISTILSDKYKDPGHIKRIDFVKFLEKKGVPIHVYGNNKWKYKDYKGSLPYHCKDDGIFPYKYHFNVENHSDRNYFTEKIVDAILGESLCFYNGCSNLMEHLPKEAFVYLHLSNFEHDYNVVQTAIREDWYSQRLPYIKKAKQIILEELQFFPRIEKIINEHKKKNIL